MLTNGMKMPAKAVDNKALAECNFLLREAVCSPEAMSQLGARVAHQWGRPGTIFSLEGDLGSGKTTFLKGFIPQLTRGSPHSVHSPTFTYLHIHTTPECDIYHFDLYRLQTPEQFLSAGFGDAFVGSTITCLEWGDRIGPLLPSRTLYLRFSHLGPSERQCILTQG